jgi:hypothetical protein
MVRYWPFTMEVWLYPRPFDVGFVMDRVALGLVYF